MSPVFRTPTNGPDADLPPYTGPVTTLLVAFTPRSGSSLLARALGETGLCGVPHEYLNFVHIDDFRLRLGPLPVPTLLRWLKRHRTTENGVFGVKASPFHIQHELIDKGIDPRPLFAPLRCVWIQRADKVRQAVSYSRALQTDRWNAAKEDQAPPHYDFAHIEWSLRFIWQQTRQWPRLFRQLGVSPVPVQYLQLVRHYEPTVRGLVGALGLGSPMQVPVPAPTQRRMPDAESLEWSARFRQEAPQRGVDARLFGPEEPVS